MNLIEEYRKACVLELFSTGAFGGSFPTWQTQIRDLCPTPSANEIFDLGDHLRDIFLTTNAGGGRTQNAVAGGGAGWEGIICWYLNLCNIGRRTIIIKHKKELIPQCVSDAMTVNYGNFPSNSESDLIAITFPDRPEYSTDVSTLALNDSAGNSIKIFKNNGTLNLKAIINELGKRDFNDLGINIIQCKTNWNDNAQVPMLWDMVYCATRLPTNVTVGRNGYSIHNVASFMYSFITLPSNRIELFAASSTCVKRVENLSGGNYWGLPTMPNVAASVKEILNRNFINGHRFNHLTTIGLNIPNLPTSFSYFHF